MPYLLKPYIHYTKGNIFNLLLRHGSQLDNGYHINEFEFPKVFMPSSELIVRGDFKAQLESDFGVMLRQVSPLHTYSVDPMRYPKSFDRFVTSDNIEEKTWRKLKKNKIRGFEYYEVKKSDLHMENLSEVSVKVKCLNSLDVTCVFSWNSDFMDSFPVVRTTSPDTLILRDEIFDIIVPYLEPEYWLFSRI